MRVKETSDDYRYFPEPDLPPLHLDGAWLEEVAAALPELPAARRTRYRDALGLSAYDASVLVANQDATALFEATIATRSGSETKAVANWVTGEYLRLRNATEGSVRVDPRELAAIIAAVGDGSITRAQGREVLDAHVASGSTAASIIEERGFRQISDASALAGVVDEVIAANPAAVADYRAGKARAIGFLVGQVMKATRGQANAALVKETVAARLEAEREGAG
jgi:aspartyl-tRNA(Asn)/glutamyl-tRNA(Gln) amidotransferase subunit B